MNGARTSVRTRRSPVAALASGALVLAACASPRDRDVAAILRTAHVAPVEPAAGSDAPLRAADPSVWTLESILTRIASANPTLGVAQARLDEARAARREALASFLPELSLGFDYVSTDEPARAFGILMNHEDLTLGPGFDPTPGSVDDWRKEIRLDWAIVAPGRRASRDAAREGEESARLAAEALERRLANAGVQAWLGLRAARALEEVARESAGVVERRVEITRTRFQEGAALRADVLRLEVRLAAAREEAARASLAAREAESALRRLMGSTALERIELADETVAIGAGLPDELEALLTRAEEERLDLRAAAHRVRMLALRGEAERAARYPALQAFAAYDVWGSNAGIDTDLDSYVAGIGLRLPLSARTQPRIRQAAAQERAASEGLRELALAASGEVRDAFEGLDAAKETLALAEAAVGAAEEAFRIVAEAQDAGAATVTDVLEAEDSARQARVRAVAARAGVEIARAKLVAAIGGVR